MEIDPVISIIYEYLHEYNSKVYMNQATIIDLSDHEQITFSNGCVLFPLNIRSSASRLSKQRVQWGLIAYKDGILYIRKPHYFSFHDFVQPEMFDIMTVDFIEILERLATEIRDIHSCI